MRCAYPVVTASGIIAPCGKCYFCRMQKRAAWVFRMQQELKANPNACFVTLTYNEDEIKKLRCRFDKRHIARWRKKLGADFETATLNPNHVSSLLKVIQKAVKQKCGDDFLARYYITGEYGDNTNRPHLHGIFYFPKTFDCDLEKFFKEVWKYGNIDIQNVSAANINYIAKHQIKDCKGNEYQQKFSPIFSRMSRYSGGIGKQFLDNENVVQYYKQNRFSGYVILNNYKIALPQFYRKKLFDKLTYDEYIQLLDSQQEQIKQHGNYEIYKRDLRQLNKERWQRLAKLKKTRKFIKNITKNIDNL